MEPQNPKREPLTRPARSSPPSGQKTKPRQVWTPDEDRILSRAVAKETPQTGAISWHKVAAHLPGRNNKDCRKRWHYSVSHTIKKGTWTKEEDERLLKAVDKYGARWSKVAAVVGSRNGDQCWKRWYDCLDPRIDKSPWTSDEDSRLLREVAASGRNWSEIVNKHFPNRTSLAAKNRYSILQRRRQNESDNLAVPSQAPMVPPSIASSNYSLATVLCQYHMIQQTPSPFLDNNTWYAEDMLSEASTPNFTPETDWGQWSPCPSTGSQPAFSFSGSPQPTAASLNLTNDTTACAGPSSVHFVLGFNLNEFYLPADTTTSTGHSDVAPRPPSIHVYPPGPTNQSQAFEFVFPAYACWES